MAKLCIIKGVIYFILLLLIALIGLFLIRRGMRKPRRLLLVLVGVILIVAPYPADLVFTRIVHIGESPTTAWLPTTAVLSALEPKADGTYGIIFDRYHKAPGRHAFFSWQAASFAEWCLACVRSGDPAMVKRGVQISGRLAHEHDAAIQALAEALEVGTVKVRLLAGDLLMGMGNRALAAKPQLEKASSDSNPDVASRAKEVLKQLNDLSVDE